jgi:hypothetical protein
MYEVSECEMDMLRYDHGYVVEKSPIDERRTKFFGFDVYDKGKVTIYSRFAPTIARWNSFGIQVGKVGRVDRPAGTMWTVKRASDGSLAWVSEEG